jgi:acetyl-CoA carboxylase biotin carboxyl carrier protein
MAGKKKPTTSAAVSSANSSELNWVEVERVLKLMDRHSLEEFEYSNGNFHVRMKRVSVSAATAAIATPGTVPAAVMPAAVPVPAPAPAAAPAPAPPAAEAEEKTHIVKSPIVGTYYGAPSPGAPAFARVGDQVQTGQVLCIIEAMKLMNEIESDIGGEITRIFVENGQPVEYGEPLFAIRPSGSGRPA